MTFLALGFSTGFTVVVVFGVELLVVVLGLLSDVVFAGSVFGASCLGVSAFGVSAFGVSFLDSTTLGAGSV